MMQYKRLLYVVILGAAWLATASSMAMQQKEHFTPFAVCQTVNREHEAILIVSESDSSSLANLTIEQLNRSECHETCFSKVMLTGMKKDDVRDPIVFEYEFGVVEVLISTERRMDDTYPGELRVTFITGNPVVLDLSCDVL